MTYKEQIEWLLKNGFEEMSTRSQKIIYWEKELEMEKKLHFAWVSRLKIWEVVISQDEDYILLAHLPETQDFNMPPIQGLVDLIK